MCMYVCCATASRLRRKRTRSTSSSGVISSASLYSVTAYCFAQPRSASSAAGIARDALERASPEDPADDRSVEDDLPLLGRERVETRRDEAADRAGQGLGRRSALAHHRCELLDEKRVPLCGLCHLGGLRVGAEEVER